MSVKSVKPISKKGKADINGERSYTWTYFVYADIAEPETAILTASGIPQWGTAHPQDSGALVKSIEAEQRSQGEQWFWSVQVEFNSKLDFPGGSQPTGSSHGGNNPTSPQNSATDRAPVWKFGSKEVQIACEQDIDGNDVINSAGSPFLPPIERPISVSTIDITRWYSSIDFSAYRSFDNAVNADSWLGLAAGSVLVHTPEVSEEFQDGNPIWKIDWHLEIAPMVAPYFGSWALNVLNKGFMALDVADVPYQIIDEATGAPVTEARLLDADGHELAEGDPPTYQTFNIYQSTSFSAIP